MPWQLRGAFVAELLFLPVGLLALAALPLNDLRAWVLVGAQVAVAVAAAFGLRRRSRIAWVAAMLLALMVVVRSISSAPELSREVIAFGRGDLVIAVTMLGWALLTQLAVLLFCITLFWHQRWRTVLR